MKESTKYDQRDKLPPNPSFVNKDLLDHGFPLPLCIVGGCLHATIAESVAQLWPKDPLQRKFACPWSRESPRLSMHPFLFNNMLVSVSFTW